MWFWAALLAFSGADDSGITENFTGRVLDGSNDRLVRVERRDVSRRSPHAIVVLEGCGVLDVSEPHEFLIWAGGWEDVRACLAVDGRPSPARELAAGFGVVYGAVAAVRDDSHRSMGGVSVRATCGERTFIGKADTRGRFWTMLPAGHCRLEGVAEGYRPYDKAGPSVNVREGAAEVVRVRMRTWGLLDRIEEWAGTVRGMFPNN